MCIYVCTARTNDDGARVDDIDNDGGSTGFWMYGNNIAVPVCFLANLEIVHGRNVQLRRFHATTEDSRLPTEGRGVDGWKVYSPELQRFAHETVPIEQGCSNETVSVGLTLYRPIFEATHP